MKLGFSIRYKFLIVMSFLLAACVAVYLSIAIKVFKNDKTELVYDLNKSQVSTLASEIDTQFEGISDKFKLFAMLTNSSSSKLVGELFGKDSDVVFVSLYKSKDGDSLRKFENRIYRETYGLSATYFEKDLVQERNIPFTQILKNGESFWNATSKNGPPLIGFGRSVVVENAEGVAIDQMAVVGYIRTDRIMKSLSLVKLSEIMVVSHEGEILAHPEAATLKQNNLVVKNPIFQSALQSKTKTSVLNLEHDGQKILGAYSKAYNGKVFVLVQSLEANAFLAVSSLVERSLIFALIVMTVAFLAAVLLSRSLTEPLAKLVRRMELVSEGDLTTQIEITTKDETAVLSDSFNKMIVDLKQSRDQLEEINRELDQKVKERTRQLEEQNHAVKEAQEALLRTTRLASAGEIAGRTAHEVLNPLTSLLTRVGIMERKIKSDMVPQTDLIKEIKTAWDKDYQVGGFTALVDAWKKPSTINPAQNLWQEDMENMDGVSMGLNKGLEGLRQDSEFLLKEGARINKIINAMRKLSVIRSDNKKHSVHDMLKECSHIMADLFEQRNYKTIYEFNAEVDNVFLDKDEFVQAVTNMMRNSLQAMHAAEHQRNEQGVMRFVTAVVDGQMQIYIEDNGIGISKDNQEHLFGGHFTTKSREEGTGIGLGISRRFVRSFGGDIDFVSSEPFVKTVFRIKLPLSQHNQGAAA